jgi:membrane fusion protein (multidrug efflux system)
MRATNLIHVLLTGLLWVGLASPESAFAQSSPTSVIVERARTASFSDRLEAVGTLTAAESVSISATVTEQIEYIGFDDGDRVEKGQVLVRFEAREEGARIEEAQASVRIAREELDRAQRIFDRGALSERELLERQRALALAEAQIASAKVQRTDRVIRAPFAGVVGLRQISVGAIVRPGDPIVRIDQVDQLNLDFSMPATRLSALQPGQPIVATASAWPGQTFEGDIKTLDSVIDPVTRSVLVRAELTNPDGVLKPGMLMTVQVQSAARSAILIDESAVIPLGRQTSVLRVVQRDGQSIVMQAAVTLGARRAGEVEVLSGLSAGDLVITHGSMKVRPGQPVTTVEVGPDEDALARYLETQDG